MQNFYPHFIFYRANSYIYIYIYICTWISDIAYIYIYIYSVSTLYSTLAKELMVATRVMQDSSNKVSTSFSDSVKCKQKEINTFTLNSQACVGFILTVGLCYQADIKLAECRFQLVVCLATLFSCDITKEYFSGWQYIYYIYIYIYIYI